MTILRSIAIAITACIAFAGCEKTEERGVSRIPGLPEGEAPRADIAPPNVQPSGSHQAPPLSEISGSAGPHSGAATTGAAMGANDTDMMIQAGQTNVRAGGNILEVAGLAFTVDESWKNIRPQSAIRVAEYQLDGANGPAEMAVFYFGQNQGGGIEDNIRRWAGQFTADAGTTSTGGAQVARMEKDNLRLALVKMEGTYDPGSMGPMGPASTGPKPNYALFGLVVAGGPEGSVFIKVTGPKETISEHNDALEAMAQSVRVSDYK